MTVKIEVYGETAGEALKELATFSAGLRNVPLPTGLSAPYGQGQQIDPSQGDVYAQVAAEIGQTDPGPRTAPARIPGQPSPGKARRTKAEIAEDEALEAAGASNIRSGSDDRPDPENPADDAATEAADAADEAAEADAGRDADAPLTIDDVKALAVEYQEKYGFEAVQEDGPKIFVEAVGKPPEGEPFWKFSILPTDQASLQKLATVWRKAIDLNPLKRTAV